MPSATQRLVIFGAGGHGSEVQAYVRDLIGRGWNGELLGFIDDAVPQGLHGNLSVIGDLQGLAGWPPEFFDGLSYLIAVGNNAVRRKIVERIEGACGARLTPWTLVHPSAYIGENVGIGAGTLLAPGSMATSRVKIGRHVILNVKASVSHDCVIGDYVNLNPGVTICGNCCIGEGAYIGAGATVIDGITIGSGAVIGAGAVVVRDVEPDVTAVGVPARVIERHDA